MSGRLVNARPKPGFMMDSTGDFIPTRDNVVPFMSDRLTNIQSGMGTTADRRVFDRYVFTTLDPVQAETGYRTDWVIRKIVDIPPFDMTREWRDWQANADDIRKLEAEEKRHQLRLKCQRALVLSRLYGGGALVLGTKDADPMQPLAPERVGLGGLTYVHVLSRWQLSHGQMRLDPADPWFGQPEYFEITSGENRTGVRLHPSRVVAFIGQRAPEGSYLSPQSWFWGDPIMQSVGQAVRNVAMSQDGFAALTDRAAVDVFKFKDLMKAAGTPEGEKQITDRVAWTSQAKSTYRAALIDAEDDLVTMQLNWGGIPNVGEMFLLVVCGAVDIPMTRFLGQSPRGLQATGDSEERDYHSMLAARQGELLEPALDHVDQLLIPSALGSRPSDIYWEFAPFDQPNQKDMADVQFSMSQAFEKISGLGVVPDKALADIVKNYMIESGQYPGAETAFEEAEKAIAADPTLDPLYQDPNQLMTREQQVAALAQKGAITPQQKDALLTDAAPRSLYVSRKLLNADAVIKWAKSQGFETTLPADDMHVTVLFSRTPVEWMEMGQSWDQDNQGKLTVPPGGQRMLDQFGSVDKATVLLFNSSSLCWRHEDMVSKGASHDFNDYVPHVTITYAAPAGLDLSTIAPYQGELIFGPEVFAEIVDDWKQGVTEE